MAISNQSCKDINDEIINTPMAGMLNLRYVLELVIYSLDDRSFPQHELVGKRHQPVLHVLTNGGDKL